jgi:hypothetical protein
MPASKWSPYISRASRYFSSDKELALGQPGILGIDDDIAVEIEHLLHILEGQIQQVADFAGQAFQKPDVGAGRGQFDVGHALPPTLDWMTSTPHFSQMTPRCFMRLYLPQLHS